jgi:hypothetical protein
MDNNYDELENQIGNAGADEQPLKPQGKGLGELQHKNEILGHQGSLSEEEQASLDRFRKNIQRDRESAAASDASIASGWIPVNREEMGIRSIFYPSDWDFYVKAAPVQAIKNWTSVNEEDAREVYNVLNEIIRTGVRIDTHSPEGAGWAKINSWDRFWFVLKVREATFANGETKVEFEDTCSECDTDIVYNLTSEALFYEYPDQDLIDKYWDGHAWQIDPNEYDVDHEPITLYTPTLGKDEAIIQWAAARKRAKKNVDENFITFLAWLLPKPMRDAEALNRWVEKIYKEYKSWSIDMYEFMSDVVKNLTINPSEKLRCTCPNCGQEATSNVQFPDGIKELFRIQSKAKKFGSR